MKLGFYTIGCVKKCYEKENFSVDIFRSSLKQWDNLLKRKFFFFLM